MVVNSVHERAAARRRLWSGAVGVVPLPVVSARASRIDEGHDDAVGVLGYFYPGKGHDEALAAAVSAGLTG